MAKNRKNKRVNKNLAKDEIHKDSLSKEELIEIYEEAYYKALKRISEEKESKKEIQKYKWYQEIWFVLNFIFFPWNINKRFKVKNNVYDNMIVLVISLILYFIGFVLWLAGIGALIYLGRDIYNMNSVAACISDFSIMLYCLFFGGVMTVSARQFSEERDSNRIYAFSTIIMGMLSCAIGIIALFK